MAPGENIYSSPPGGGYGYMDGTSMAGPHVAGVVALMREAAPDLDVDTIKDVLMQTAVDLGASGEDNNYGHGGGRWHLPVHGIVAGSYLAALTLLATVFEIEPQGVSGHLSGHEILRGGVLAEDESVLCDLPTTTVAEIEAALGAVLQRTRLRD